MIVGPQETPQIQNQIQQSQQQVSFVTMIVKDNRFHHSHKDIAPASERNSSYRTKKHKYLNPNAQRLLLENSIVNGIQNKIAYANAFDLRSFRLRLEMEEEEVVA
jgi:hypothetical protein